MKTVILSEKHQISVSDVCCIAENDLNLRIVSFGANRRKTLVQIDVFLSSFIIVVWVNQAQTLDEQGIGELDGVLLRRRYFYSDRNVDARDPVQLNLLYVQVYLGCIIHPACFFCTQTTLITNVKVMCCMDSVNCFNSTDRMCTNNFSRYKSA